MTTYVCTCIKCKEGVIAILPGTVPLEGLELVKIGEFCGIPVFTYKPKGESCHKM